MTAQLLDYPTSRRVRSRAARQSGGVPVAPHRRTRRNLGPVQRTWHNAQAASPRPTTSGSETLYWTPLAMAIAVILVTLLAVVMLVTLVTAFLAVSPEPLIGAAQMLPGPRT